MSRKDSDAVKFHDASAYFSEDEWTLLQEWQKELYRNVMMEIHQALLSLGPLIATTVCSLRAKEKEELCPMDMQYPDRRPKINHSPCNTMSNPNVLFRANDEEPPRLRNPQDSKGMESFPCFSTDICLRKEEEPVSIFIDHLGAEIRESSTDTNSGHEVFSFRIKDEKDASYVDHQDRKGTEGISCLTGDGTRNRKSKIEDAETIPGKTIPYKMDSGTDDINFFQSPDNETQYNSQMWSEMTQESEGDQTSLCETGFSNTAQRSEKQNDWQSDPKHAKHNTRLPEIHKNWRLYSCNECDKSFSRKAHLIQHKKIHTGVRPYQCNECEKSFSRKEHLIVHKRTHTGLRPYHCNICGKSFTQTGVLIRHQRTHTQDRPYQCTECEKCFSRKGHLVIHQKTHTQHR